MFRLVGLIALAIAVNAASLAHAADQLPQSGADTIDTAQVERGRYMAKLGDCAACHNAEDGAPMPAAGPS